MNFLDKLRELIEAADADAGFRATIEQEAEDYLAQIADWPVATQVPLARVAAVVAGLLIVPDTNVRRLRATDGIKLRDSIG